MGGYGSGRPGRLPTIEGTASLVLDVTRLMAAVTRALRRHGMTGIPEQRTVTLEPFAWRWTRAGEAEPWAELSIGLTLGPDWGEAVLRYDIEHLTCPTGPAARDGAPGRDAMPVRGRAMVVGLPGELPPLRQALPAQWRAAVPEPGRLAVRLRLATRHLGRSRARPHPPAASQARQRLRELPRTDWSIRDFVQFDPLRPACQNIDPGYFPRVAVPNWRRELDRNHAFICWITEGAFDDHARVHRASVEHSDAGAIRQVFSGRHKSPLPGKRTPV